MKLDYVPLLQVQREIQGMPKGIERFRHYLRTIWNCYETEFELVPLIAANPMGKEHVTALLDELLALGAEQIAADAAALASARLPDVPWDFKAATVVADDLKGGWTNRFADEFTIRFGAHDQRGRDEPGPAAELQPPRWSKFAWVTAVLWSSEPASAQCVRESMLAAVYRIGYVYRHGSALTLRDMLEQEGQVMARAGCTAPFLEEDDIVYTREVLEPHLGATDKRTCIECLFGDSAGQTLGFTPRGLSPWAGLAMALHDARSSAPAIN
jgi:hypothetical protein